VAGPGDRDESFVLGGASRPVITVSTPDVRAPDRIR